MLLELPKPKAKAKKTGLQLRWYQQDAVTAALDLLENELEASPLVVLPTGAGKSVWCAEVVRQFHERTGKRVLVVILRQGDGRTRRCTADCGRARLAGHHPCLPAASLLRHRH